MSNEFENENNHLQNTGDDDFILSDGFSIDGEGQDEKDYDLDMWTDYVTAESKRPHGSETGENNEDSDVIYSSSEKEEEAHLRSGAPSHTRTKSRKKTKKKFSKTKKILLSAVLIVLITFCLIVSAFSIYVFAVVDDDIGYNLNNLSVNYSTVIYAKNRDTEEYSEYCRLHGSENRVWVDSSEFSPYICDAIVAIEDKRFYQHEGVDWKRTFSAFLNMFFDIYGGTQGGSTITQQLVKNLTGDKEQTPQRKIQEIMRARNIEKNYAKSTIIECYANIVHFGNGCDGVQVAAQYYFGKDAKDLTLLECASLAATIQTPATKNPIDGPEVNKERRETCLALMLEQELISKEQYDEAMSQELVVVDHSSKSSTDDDSDGEKLDKSNVYDFFVETVIDDVIDDLVNIKGYPKDEAQRLLYSGGLQIYSTVDPYVQRTMEEVFADDSNFAKVGKKEEQPQAAMTLMDYNGHIVGIMGGRGEKTANRILNRATTSKRQPGSSIKPLAAYSPAIELNLATYSTYIEDAPIKFNGKNYPDRGSYANVTLQNALSRSLNCVAVRLVNKIGVDKSYEFVEQRYHISTLVESYTRDDGTILTDHTLSSMALGGMVNGVTTKEMAAAYACFGNLGVYWKPTTYTKIVNTFGDEILSQDTIGTQSISQETANVMNEIMQTAVTGSGGTARPAAFGGWPIFAKTGTTNDNYDRWMVAGTPYYVAACWYGFDTPAEMGGTSYNPCIYFWKPVMKKIHEKLELCDFAESGSVSYRYYCTSSGELATDRCSNVALGFYKNSYLPVCSQHGGAIRAEVTKPSPVGGKFAEIYAGGLLPEYEPPKSVSEESSDSSESTSGEESAPTEESSTPESEPSPSSNQIVIIPSNTDPEPSKEESSPSRPDPEPSSEEESKDEPSSGSNPDDSSDEDEGVG